MTEEAPNTAEQTEISASGEVRSTVNRPWLVRIVVISLMLIAYGVWSMYDAYVSYPARGAEYASWSERAYLISAQEVDESREELGAFRKAGIGVSEALDTPLSARLEQLRERREQNVQDVQGTSRPKRARMELALQEWLTALSRIDRLHPAYTGLYRNPDPAVVERLAELEAVPPLDRTVEQSSEIRTLTSQLGPQSAGERLAELDNRWMTRSQPSKLQSYDIPVNKITGIGCFLFALYLIGLFIAVATRTYTWDPATQRLTFPSGESIVPSDLSDIDKSKWEKFIIFLLIKDSHAKLGGREIKVDTYRHGRVEEWILEMEKTAFPERVAEDAKAAEAAAEAAGEIDAEGEPVESGSDAGGRTAAS